MTVSNLFKDLNNYLAERSYIDGYQPSQADLKVLEVLNTKPTAETPYLLRWYNHIQSYDANTKKQLVEKSLKPEINNIISTKVSVSKADDDDVDLFGSDEEEDAEALRIKEERLQAYAAKKSKKPTVVAKSSIILDVKPWDDETDMKKMEECVRSIVMDGLLWGASSLKPVGYGINKLVIMCVVEDDKVSVDDLTDKIQEFEDYVQSIDIAAFNKI